MTAAVKISLIIRLRTVKGQLMFLFFSMEFGPPFAMISDARTIISAARLTVLYTLKHAGGYDPNTVGIMVACGIVGSFDPEEPGSGGGFPDAEFEEECAMNCFNSTDDLKSQIKFENDVLEAGKSYICSVAAQNMEGTFYYTTSPIIATTGIPMKPTLSVVNGSRSINLTVSSPFPGVPLNDPSFVFEINVTDSANDTVYSSTFNGTFIDRDISIGLPAGGIYTVEVYSQNKYGISDTAVAVVLANVQTTDPPTLEDNSKFPLEAIVGIAVGGTILVFAIFITIVIIVICLVKVKGKRDSVSFYQSKYEMTIKRY